MNAHDDEDRQLRAVAFQNANAIQLARQRAERELAREREWLRITLASIGDAVISTDDVARIAFMNGVAERLTGWPQAEAAGRPLGEVFRIFNEFTRTEVESPVLRALREGVVGGLANHTILVSRDGAEWPIDDCAAPMRDESGAAIGAVLVFRDVTERKQAEEARARLAAVVESSDDGIVGKTIDGIIRTWNAGAERLFGYPAAEAIGRPITLIIPPERLDEEREIIDRLIRGERIDHFETVRVRKDGRRIDISIAVSPLRDSEGRIIGASKIARDITERKRKEEENAQLYLRLQEQDRRKDEFLATLAHELRNPLAPIRNGMQILRIALQDDNRVTRSMDMMERQLAHMVHLVDDLMDVARVSSGKIVLRKHRVSLKSVVESAVEATRLAMEAGGHEFSSDLPPEPLVFDADRTRLAQVLGNLLHNAAKYTPSGGRIRLTAERDGTHAVIRVTDTGLGISAEMLPKVFDLFTQVGASLERAQGGLGIGLTLVKRLVEMHEGTVSADSHGPNQGSTFTVRLPLAPETDAAAGSGEHRPLLDGPPLRVMVVDDNRDAADSLALLLQMKGHEVRAAHDGQEALRVLRTYCPDLILLDLGLPGMTGYDVARHVRETPAMRGVTIAAVTGWGQEEDRTRTRQAGFDYHLTKPAAPADLERIIWAVRGR